MMYGAALSQGAQALNRTPQVGGYTGDYYQAKQKECQIIRIQSSDSEFQVNCPNIRPNFSNLSGVTGAHMQDIYYQVRSFTTIPKYYNCEEGMSLRLRIKRFSVYDQQTSLTGLTGPDSQYKHVILPVGTYISLPIDVIRKQCLTQQELIDYIYWEVARKYAELTQRYANTDYTTEQIQVGQDQAFLYLFDNASFSYLSESNKFALYLRGDNSKFRGLRPVFRKNCLSNGIPTLWTTAGKLLGGIELVLSCDPTMSREFQIRLARMLGFTEVLINENGDEELCNNFYVNDTALIPYHLSMSPNFFPQNMVGAVWKEGLDLTQTPSTTGNFLRSLFVDNFFYDTCKAPMKMVRYNRIFIRSSLLNNMWRADGTKGDEICVVPIATNLNDNILVYQPTGAEARTYEVKETSGGAVSFNLRITDENNSAVEFLEDYEIQIAFFYCPDKSLMSQF